MEPIPDTQPSRPTPDVVESDDERAARRRALMKAAAAESRARIAADLVWRTDLTSPTGAASVATDETLPNFEELAAQVYLRTALRSSADLRQACETRKHEMRAIGASEYEVFDALLSMARAHSEATTAPSVPIGSFDAVMPAWERGDNPHPGKEGSNV